MTFGSTPQVVDMVSNQMENKLDVDVHFRPESHIVSMRDIQYDFIVKVGNLAEDLAVIFTSLGLPDKFLGEEWGESGDSSFAEAEGMNVVNMTEQLDRSSHFKTMIRKMYKDDYALFGLWLGLLAGMLFSFRWEMYPLLDLFYVSTFVV